MIFFSYFLILGVLLLGLYQITRPKVNLVRLAYFVLTLSLAVWILMICEMNAANQVLLFRPRLWAKLIFICPVLASTALWLFFRYYPAQKMTFSWLNMLLVVVLPCGMILAILGSLVVTGLAVPTLGSFRIMYHPIGHKIYGLYIVAYLFFAFRAGWQNLRILRGVAKTHLQYFLVGSLLTASFAVLINLLLPVLHIYNFSVFGPLSTVIFVLSQFYTLWQPTSMRDLKILSIEVISFFMASIFLGSVFYLILNWQKALLVNYLIYKVLILACGVLVCWVFAYLQQRIQIFLLALFAVSTQSTTQKISDFTQKLAYGESIISIIDIISEYFFQYITPQTIIFYLPQQRLTAEAKKDELQLYRAVKFLAKGQGVGEEHGFQFDCPRLLSRDLQKVIGVFTCADEIGAHQDLYQTYGWTLGFSCIANNELEAVIILGAKNSRAAYTREDLLFLRAAATRIAFVLERSKPQRVLEEAYQASLDIAEKMSNQLPYATMALSIAHDLNGPLRILESGLDAIINNIEDKEATDHYIEELKRNVLRLSNLVSSTLSCGTLNTQREEGVSVSQLLSNLVLLTSAECQKRNIKILMDDKGALQLFASPDSLTQAFLSIIINAMEAIDTNGTITLKLSLRQEVARAWQVVEIKDTGVGILGESAHEIFEPFFSTKQGHVGLGLTGAKKIIEEHGGQIVVAGLDNGMRLIVTLPGVINA